MAQSSKIIGLLYQDTIYYAIFINMLKFDSPEEVQLLTKQAGISPYRMTNYLLMTPLQEVGHGVEVVFTKMPGSMVPREPYVLSSQFILGRWDDIPSGAIVNTQLVAKHGLLGWDGNISDYIVEPC